MVYHFSAFRNVEIQPYNLTWSNNRPQYRSCEFCGMDAVNVMFKQSNMTDHRYEQNVCEEHGKLSEALALFKTEKQISVEFWRAYEIAYYKAFTKAPVDSQKLFDTVSKEFVGTIYLNE